MVGRAPAVTFKATKTKSKIYFHPGMKSEDDLINEVFYAKKSRNTSQTYFIKLETCKKKAIIHETS